MKVGLLGCLILTAEAAKSAAPLVSAFLAPYDESPPPPSDINGTHEDMASLKSSIKLKILKK